MSRATLYVQFPDGTVRYGLYDGTSDVACSPLYSSPHAAWDVYDLSGSDGEVPDEAERVHVASDYGGGFSWVGLATRDRLVGGFEPDVDYESGLPSWARYPESAR